MTMGAARRRRMDWRAPLVAVLVLIAGAVLGAGAFQFEQSRATWRPKVTRTATGWTIRDTYGHGPYAMALAGDHLAWESGDNIVTMDLSSGRTKLLGTGGRLQGVSVSTQYAVWLTMPTDGRPGGASVFTYDFASGRRVQLAGFVGARSSPAISGSTIVWTTTTGGGTGPNEVRSEDLSTGRQFVLAKANVGPRGSGQGERTIATIAGNLVGWDRGSAGPHTSPTIFVRDLSLGQTWTIVPFRATPRMEFHGWYLSGHTVVWVQSTVKKDRSGETLPASSTMIAENLDSGVRRVVLSGRPLTFPAWAIDGDLVVWTQSVGGKPATLVMGLRLSGGQPFVIDTVEQSNVPYLLVSGNTVAMLLNDNGHTSWIQSVRIPQ
jgi:Tol biopolymer transport system component